MVAQCIHGGQERAWHIGAQDQKLCHARRCNGVTVGFAINLKARHAAQNGGPVVVLAFGVPVQQLSGCAFKEFHVEQARHVVGSFQRRAQCHEAIRIVARHGAGGDAAR